MIRASIAAIILAASGFAAQDSPPALSSDGEGGLRKDGKPFRAIGVNYFSCFYRTLLDGADTSYDQGFEVLAREGIPFVRFASTGKPSYNEEWLRGRDLNPRPSGYEYYPSFFFSNALTSAWSPNPRGMFRAISQFCSVRTEMPRCLAAASCVNLRLSR